MEAKDYEQLRGALLEGRMAEFRYRGKNYLFQQENNKGWDYLSIWRSSSPAVCLGRALFEIWDGIDEETVDALLREPCIDEKCFQDLLPEIEELKIL